MNLSRKQRGFLSWQWLMLIIASAFVLMVVTKLGPHYADNRYIEGALKSLAENNPNFHSLSKEEVRAELDRFLTINNVRGKEITQFKIVRRTDYTIVNSVYEIRVPFALNVDVVLTFKKQLDSRTPEICCIYDAKDAKTE